MADEIQKQCTGLIRSIDRKKHQVTSIVSTGSVDRYNEIILPSAFADSLKGYLENGVLLWGHQSYGGPEAIIGKCLDAKLVAEGLQCTFEYLVDVNPLAKTVWDFILAGAVRAFSIGAIPKAWIDRYTTEPDLTSLPAYARDAFLAGQARRVYTKVDWVETSQVIVPANKDALLAAALSTEDTDREFALRALGEIELLRDRQILNTTPKEAPNVQTPQTPGPGPEDLKKAVQEALKEGLAETVRDLVQKELAAAKPAPVAPAPAPAEKAAPEDENLKRELQDLIQRDPDAVLAALAKMTPAA